MLKPDYYAILGVARDATDLVIRAAYRRAAMKHHPDRGGEVAVFVQIQEAYSVLGDASKRAAHDRQAGFEGLFADLFRSGAGATAGRPGARPACGADRVMVVEVNLETRVFGGRVEIRPTHVRRCRPCDGRGCAECGRRGVVQGQWIRVAIPAGLSEGRKIRLTGCGEIGPGGCGDIILGFRTRYHPLARISGDDLVLHRPVKVPAVVLRDGGRIRVPTLKGDVVVTIAPAVSGVRIRVARCGAAAGGFLRCVLEASDGRMDRYAPAPRSRSKSGDDDKEASL